MMSRQYEYKKLENIELEKLNNVYAIVEYVIIRQKTTSVSMVLKLSDETTRGLKCEINADIESSLPEITNRGQIVRLHRIKCPSKRRELYGDVNKGFGLSVLVWDGSQGSTKLPKSMSKKYTINENDHKRVEELRKWWDQLPPAYNTFKDFVDIGSYLNVVARVIGVFPGENKKSVVLSVCDATIIRNKKNERVECAEIAVEEVLSNDVEFTEKMVKYVYHVFVYDEHAETAKHFKTGDYVLMYNLHYHRPPKVNQPILVMHGGTSYDRHIKKIDIHHPTVQQIINNIGAILHGLDVEIIEVEHDNQSAIPENKNNTNNELTPGENAKDDERDFDESADSFRIRLTPNDETTTNDSDTNMEIDKENVLHEQLGREENISDAVQITSRIGNKEDIKKLTLEDLDVLYESLLIGDYLYLNALKAVHFIPNINQPNKLIQIQCPKCEKITFYSNIKDVRQSNTKFFCLDENCKKTNEECKLTLKLYLLVERADKSDELLFRLDENVLTKSIFRCSLEDVVNAVDENDVTILERAIDLKDKMWNVLAILENDLGSWCFNVKEIELQ